MLALANASTKSHEDAHKQINNQFGIKSNITYGFLGLDGITTAYLNGTADIEAYNEAKIYHIWNEIIGYHFDSLNMTIIMAALMLSVSIIMSKAVKA
jgi:hypothetical protein